LPKRDKDFFSHVDFLYPCSTVVEQRTQNPKIYGLNPTSGTGKEKMAKSLSFS
jgi:hypothetical protein